MKKALIFTIADNNNLRYYDKFYKSLRHFHTEEEVDVVLIDEAQIKQFNDPSFFYRAKPRIAKEFIGKYEFIIGADVDQIFCGDISHLWTDTSVDAKCVLNSNPIEAKVFPVSVWDISPFEYLNAGLVVMKNPKFIEHWLGLCYGSKFNNYQFREQDLLNIIAHYGDYKVELLDAGPCFWGLSSKGYWNKIELKDNKLVLPKGEDGWPTEDKEIKVIHVAGGNMPTNKFNFGPYMKEDVVEWLDEITK